MGWRVMSERTVFSFELGDLSWSPTNRARVPRRMPSGRTPTPTLVLSRRLPHARRESPCPLDGPRLGSTSLGAQPATLPAGNLPVELTSFVGRRQDLADLERALGQRPAPDAHRRRRCRQDQARPASRLARAPASTPHGVWFVELAPVQDPELVVQAVFTALGLQDHSSSWAVSTLERLSRRQAAAADPRQLRARPRCGGRPGRSAAARLPGVCGSSPRAGRRSGSPARS